MLVCVCDANVLPGAEKSQNTVKVADGLCWLAQVQNVIGCLLVPGQIGCRDCTLDEMYYEFEPCFISLIHCLKMMDANV